MDTFRAEADNSASLPKLRGLAQTLFWELGSLAVVEEKRVLEFQGIFDMRI